MNDDQERLPVDVRDLHALRLHQLRSAARAEVPKRAPLPKAEDKAEEARSPQSPLTIIAPEGAPPSEMSTPETPSAGIDCEPEWEDAPDVNLGQAVTPHVPPLTLTAGL